jgi:hypothetical protein
VIGRLIGAAGVLVVLVVAADIFRSLLVPRANSRLLRVGPLLGEALFSGWHAAAGFVPDRHLRQTMRASFAPLVLVLTLAIWAGLLILGFGLLFWADRGHFEPGFANLGDAIYAAGSAFSTLGIDGHVSGMGSRLAVLICSVAGLAIVTVVATFLISIQAGIARRETLVLRLEAHVTLPPAGIAILETYARECVVDALGPFFDSWELWAAEVALSHRAFPILLFFRSNDDRCEWLAAFGAVLDAAALVDAALADPPADARAGAHFLLRTGARMLDDLARQSGVAGEDPLIADEVRFRRHRDRLDEAGYPVVADEAAALRRYADRRRSYAGPLATLARRLRIDVDERTADDPDSEPAG